MKKLFTTLLAIIAFAGMAFAQSPDGFNYQMVVRNNAGQLIVNKNVSVRITILKGSQTGTEVYTQTLSKMSNSNGLVTFVVGQDENGNVEPQYAAINWADGPYFIKSEVDPSNGTNFTLQTNQQILSVPYAEYADEAGRISDDGHQDLTLLYDQSTGDLTLTGLFGSTSTNIPVNGNVHIHVNEYGDTTIVIGDTAVRLTPTLAAVLERGNNGGNKQIKGLADPTDLQDAVTLKYLNDALDGIGGGNVHIHVNEYGDTTLVIGDTSVRLTPTLQQVLDRNNNAYNQIHNLSDPTAPLDAVNLKTLNDAIAGIDPEVHIHVNEYGDTTLIIGDTAVRLTPTLQQVLDRNNNAGDLRIVNLHDPINPKDAVNLKTLNDAIAGIDPEVHIHVNEYGDTTLIIGDTSVRLTPTLRQVLERNNNAGDLRIVNLHDPINPKDAVNLKTLNEALAGLVHIDPNGDTTIVIGDTTIRMTPNLRAVLQKGNQAYSKITYLSDPTDSLDAVNFRTLMRITAGGSGSGSGLPKLYQVLANGSDGNSAGNRSIRNLADPVNDQDAVNLRSMNEAINGALDTVTLAKLLEQNPSAGNHKITNLLAPTNNNDAATKKYVDDKVAEGVNGITLYDVLFNDNNAQGYGITGLPLNPTGNTSAATKWYVDNTIATALSNFDVDVPSLAEVLVNGGNSADTNRIENLADPRMNKPLDAVNVRTLKNTIHDSLAAALSNLDVATPTLQQVLAAGNSANNQIHNISTPTAGGDATNKDYVDNAITNAIAGITHPVPTLTQVLNINNNAGGNRITNITTNANSSTDAANVAFVNNRIASQNLDSILRHGNNAGGQTIINLGESTDPTAAATVNYVNNRVNSVVNNSLDTLRLSSILDNPGGNDAGGNRITNVGAPISNTDVVNKYYVDNTVANAIANAPTPSLYEVMTEGNNNSAGGNPISNLGNPTNNYDAATKIYVDNKVADAISQIPAPTTPDLNNVLDAGNSANGKTITNLGNPTNQFDAANKKYVDDKVADAISQIPAPSTPDLNEVLGAGNSANNQTITNLGNPVNNTDAVNKQYVDNAVANVPTPRLSDVLATNNGNYANNWIKNLSTPVESGDAANKLYVDNAISTAVAGITHPIPTLSQVLDASQNSAGNKQIKNVNNPTDGKDAANKQYVDAADNALSNRIDDLEGRVDSLIDVVNDMQSRIDSLIGVVGIVKHAPIDGELNGIFSVSVDKKVRFSKGVLQYRPYSDSWHFAARQFDYANSHNNTIGVGASNTNWIDLFGFGTSGWHNATEYLPYASSTVNTNYLIPDGASNGSDLLGDNVDGDWGYHNRILNGANSSGIWRTLTVYEWNYLLEQRPNASQLKTIAKVEGRLGLLIFPDNYTGTVTQGTIVDYANSAWTALQEAGVVFLPCAGRRSGNNVVDNSIGHEGWYWTVNHNDNVSAKAIKITQNGIEYMMDTPASQGCTVRLVKDYVE